MLEAVSALRNSVASKDLAGSILGFFLDRGNCEAKNPLVETENQSSLSNEGPHPVWVRTPGVLTGGIPPVGVGRPGKTLARQ